MKRTTPSTKFSSAKPRGTPLLVYAFGVLAVGLIGFMGFLMFGHFPAPQKLITEDINHDRFQF